MRFVQDPMHMQLLLERPAGAFNACGIGGAEFKCCPGGQFDAASCICRVLQLPASTDVLFTSQAEPNKAGPDAHKVSGSGTHWITPTSLSAKGKCQSQ